MTTVVILLLLFLVIIIALSPSQKGERILYQDKGERSRVFVNKRFGIAAKPDTILRTDEGDICIEFKSRKKGVYPSDIAEAKAAALAARSKYRIIAIEIRNQTECQKFYLPKDDKLLYSEIQQYVEMAKVANTELLPATPQKIKCNSCPVNQNCNQRAI